MVGLLLETHVVASADFISRTIIKTSSKEETLHILRHEYSCYMNPAIRSSQHLRTMYDAINIDSDSEDASPNCLAFEWMECTLKDVSSEAHKRNSVLY
jgi:hypothetical protein